MPKTYSEKDLQAIRNNEVIAQQIEKLRIAAQIVPRKNREILREFLDGFDNGRILNYVMPTEQLEIPRNT